MVGVRLFTTAIIAITTAVTVATTAAALLAPVVAVTTGIVGSREPRSMAAMTVGLYPAHAVPSV